MRRFLDPHPPEVQISGLARAQEGVVSTSQLRAVGFGEGAIRRRVEAGRWRRVHRGVYVLGPARLSQRGRWWAALLACGEGAVVSHASAAALWGIRSFESAKTHVTVPSRSGRRPDERILLHRVASLHPEAVTWRHRIPVTTPARTLLDLAGTLSCRQLERAFDEAERLPLQRLDAVHAQAVANPRRRGVTHLRAVMEAHQPGSTRTRTYLEEKFFAACDG
ncbi:MAG: type IV toxin-antitoxin system AbiEi family antitoxin domain-containing protein, partial [Actinomycetota bacterium]|nr:type IV toxin-antitoxin system AbiEi family antitoxin domain-containing protein [Actinomycetota bacterium]